MTEASWSKGPPRRILLATDLSARCDRALDRAAALAAEWNAELVVVHALEQSEDFYAGDLERRLPAWRQRDAARIAEEQLRADLREAAPRMVVVVEKGDPAEIVLRVAEARNCDLIVTGIARDETLGRFGLGATVDRLLRRSRVPLLIVKGRVRGPYCNIVVATDFSESARAALRAANAFFPDRHLAIFHAYDVPFAGMTNDPDRYRSQYRSVATADCAAFLAASDIPEARRPALSLLVEYGAPGRVLQQCVGERGTDLVVLGTHGRSALFDALLGSTARDILWSLPCDALIVREPRARVEGETAAR